MIETRTAKLAEMKTPGLSQERFDALTAEVRALDGDLKRIATVEALDSAATAAPAISANELRGYSVAKAIREGADNLTGLEREAHLELGRGREVRGVMIPTDILFGGEQRAMLTTGTAGNTVATDLGPMIDRLRPVMAIQGLGATVISGLTGNLDLPRLTSGPSAVWVNEEESTTASDATFDKVSLKPKTVSGEMYLSRRLQLQNGVALENVLRSDLAFVLAQALDKAAIHGTSAAKQPVGLLAAVAKDATAETELSDIAADLIAALEVDDVTGTTAFLTNPALLATVRKLKDTTGRLIPASEVFHGERVQASNQVAAVATKNPLIFGAWSNLMVGYWSGVDILANPYSDASKGGLRLHDFLDADIAVRHPEAFAWTTV